jgi:hypothetical protein
VVPEEFAEFCGRMVRRYVGSSATPIAQDQRIAAVA